MIIIAKGKFSQPRKPKFDSDELDDLYEIPAEEPAAAEPEPVRDSTLEETMLLTSAFVPVTGQTAPQTPPVSAVSQEEISFEEEIFREETADDPEEEYYEDEPPVAKSGSKGRKRKKSRVRKALVISLCVVTLLLLVVIGAAVMMFINANKDDGLILNNVTVAGVNIGGMTPEEASAAIHRVTDLTFTTENMVIYLPDTILELSPKDTGAKLDVNAAVEAAFNYGRTGTAEENKQAQAQSLVSNHTIALLPYLNLNTDFIREQLEEYGAYFNSDYEASSWTLEGQMPQLEADKYDENVKPQTLVLIPGQPGRYVDIDQVYNDVLDAYSMNHFEVRTNMTDEEQMPEALDLDEIHKMLHTDAVDAAMDMDTFEVTPEVYGYTFDLEKAKELLPLEYGTTVEIPMAYIIPKVLSADLSEKLFRDELAACGTPHTSDKNRNTNLQLACDAVNGYILMPGDTFDYNKVLGERTEERGFKPAGALSAGTSTTEVGGGICQISSTMYYCTLIADLEIVTRRSHSLPSSYMPMTGVDATVSWGGPDFRFKNNTNYPIRIEAKLADGKVQIKLLGTDEKDYYVKMEAKTVEVLRPQTIEETYTAAEAKAKGYKDGQVLEKGVTGYTVYSYKCKYDKETDELISRDYEATSNYVKKDQIVVKVEAEPTEPKPTDPPATEPPATQPPATQPPATQPPATQPPATQPPATQPPATQPPATQPPATQAPAQPDAGAVNEPPAEGGDSENT